MSMQGDIANAYGEIRRTAVMDAILSECPELAPYSRVNGRRPRTSRFWWRSAAHVCTQGTHTMTQGVWQGSALSNPAFCMPLMKALRAAVSEFNSDHSPAEKATSIAYVDYLVLVSPKARGPKWSGRSRASASSLLLGNARHGRRTTRVGGLIWTSRSTSVDAVTTRRCLRPGHRIASLCGEGVQGQLT